MSLRSINLNLIPVLQALLREGNVSRAAASLGLSQPATSAALSRLRVLLGDPLLVQVGRTMRLTPRAKAIIPQLEQLCAAMEALLQDDSFDPGRAERVFVVAAPDYLVFLLGERLLSILRERSPKIRVRFVDVPLTLAEHMAAGQLDACICADIGLWPDLHRLGGFADAMVGVAAKDHPLLQRRPPAGCETVADYPQLTFGVGVERARAEPPPFPHALPGVLATALLATQQFMVLPFLASQSDCIARIPRSLAERAIEILPLEVIELPHGRSEIDTTLFWGPVQDGDPAHRWFRSLLVECMEAYFGSAGRVAPATEPRLGLCAR